MESSPTKIIAVFSGRFRFLSNFYIRTVQHNGFIYGSSEAAFQAAKSPGNEHLFVNLSPAKAKQLGRKIVLREDWDEVKVQVMLEVLFCKFGQHPDLQKLLLDTEGYKLIEGNTWNDTYWGECPLGNGKNMLGILLMQVRDYYLGNRTTGNVSMGDFFKVLDNLAINGIHGSPLNRFNNETKTTNKS